MLFKINLSGRLFRLSLLASRALAGRGRAQTCRSIRGAAHLQKQKTSSRRRGSASHNLQSDIIAQHPQIYLKLPNTRATHFRVFPKTPNTRVTSFRAFRKVPNTRATSFPVFRKGKSTSATTFPETFSHRPSSLKPLVFGKSLKTKNLSVSGKVRFTGYDS